jgi:hypothetical protein
VEQAVHSVDKIGWAFGDTSPILCRATGGLSVPQAGGNIFDHFHIAYEYPNNVWCHMASRKTPGCKNENADFIRGTKGSLILGRGKFPYIVDNEGKQLWSFRLPRGQREASMLQVEHDEFFASIRSGKHMNDGPRMIHSTMMAIMGRMSAHTGQEVTWEQAMAAEEEFFPNWESMKWDQSYTPAPVAVPGVTKIGGIG